MALNGEDKEMRISCSLGYNPIENQDQIHHLQHQDEMIQQDKASSPTIHGGATATTALNSGRSKPKAPVPGPVAAPGAARSSTSTRYRECLKNHAANIGGNVTDGCGEFMPCGEDGTIEALKCAACNCHRNFHRKEIRSDAIVVHPFQLTPPPFLSPNMNHHRRASMVQPPSKMAFAGAGGGGGGSGSVATDSSSEELNFNVYQSNNTVGAPPPPPFILSKKRSRTKFTQEQKDKMLEFAEKVGWRIPREDDIEVQRFCAEVGVKRQVFKVWMHNNKNLSAKKNPQE